MADIGDYIGIGLSTLADSILLLLPGVLVAVLVQLIYKRHKRDNIIQTMFMYFLLHGERLAFVKKLDKEDNKKSHGSFDVTNISNLVAEYLALGDRSIKRKDTIILLYDALYQISFHFNTPISERYKEVIVSDKELRSVYSVAISFIKSKFRDYVRNMYELEKVLPCFKLRDYLSGRRKKGRSTYALRLLEEKLPYWHVCDDWGD